MSPGGRLLYLGLTIGMLQLTVQTANAQTAKDALLDVLVFGTHVPIDPQEYSGPLRTDLDRYLTRARNYVSTTPVPAFAEGKMVHAAIVTQERKLVAISADTNSATAARTYVRDLRPCYEWEGFHDCPEREAVFADQYHTANPRGPFSGYLPLLAAHRWLCAAEAYEDERMPAEAKRSRQSYEDRLKVALGSNLLLVRAAAERLRDRKSCLAPR